MREKRCDTCRYSKERESKYWIDNCFISQFHRHCHYNPPRGAFPIVRDDDFCSQHRENEDA